MSLISSTVSAASVLPALGVHGHHKKGATAAAADPSGQAQASSTEGLLSRLLQTVQQVTGVPLDALAGLAAPATVSPTTLQTPAADSPRHGHAAAGGAGGRGANVNISA